MKIKLAISGCCGKMGKRILTLAHEDKNFKVVSILEKAGHPSAGSDVSGLKVSDSVESLKEADVLIEFTSPQATIGHLRTCIEYGMAMVIGTTGLSEDDKKKIVDASDTIPVVFSPNMAVGVNLLFALVKEAAKKLSNDYKVIIKETHHVHKKDAPSGTAKQLAHIIEEGGVHNVKDIESRREGEVTGDHDVMFISEKDSITLSHSAKTRDIFAQGALVAAKFIMGKKKGLFDMQRILEEMDSK